MVSEVVKLEEVGHAAIVLCLWCLGPLSSTSLNVQQVLIKC